MQIHEIILQYKDMTYLQKQSFIEHLRVSRRTAKYTSKPRSTAKKATSERIKKKNIEEEIVDAIAELSGDDLVELLKLLDEDN